MLPSLTDGGFWERFPMLVQPLAAGGSALLRLQPPGSKSRAVQISRTPSTGLEQFSTREKLKCHLQ